VITASWITSCATLPMWPTLAPWHERDHHNPGGPAGYRADGGTPQ
jgi:hypothetical protein